jgi:hypothetical protein
MKLHEDPVLTDDRRVERDVVVDADPDEVWEALTDEDRLSEWLAPEVELDPVEGGELTVRDAGRMGEATPGLGLGLVRQIAERGLGGTFELRSRPTEAVLRFNVDADADPDRRGRPGHRDWPGRPPEGARA